MPWKIEYSQTEEEKRKRIQAEKDEDLVFLSKPKKQFLLMTLLPYYTSENRTTISFARQKALLISENIQAVKDFADGKLNRPELILVPEINKTKKDYRLSQEECKLISKYETHVQMFAYENYANPMYSFEEIKPEEIELMVKIMKPGERRIFRYNGSLMELGFFKKI